MPAPKGNKNAAKDNPKSALFGLKMRPDSLEILKKIAVREKISAAQVVEKALLATYPTEFLDKF